MKKLFVTDLDGTLLNENHDLSEGSKKAVTLLQDHGYDVVLASGRSRDLMLPIYKHLGLKTPCIFNNGAGIYNNDGSVSDVCSLESDDVKIIIDYIIENELPYVVQTLNQTYIGGDNSYVKKYEFSLKSENGFVYKRINDPYEVVKFSDVTKILILMHDIVDQKPFVQSELTKNENITVLASDTYLIDIMAKNVDKNNAVMKLVTKYGYEHVTAIGDNENDVMMIKSADFGIGMKNGVKQVYDVAKFVTPRPHSEEGFLSAVEYIINGGNDEI
jgi:Cof subfamily protein (haloacid dehalogenase superfamily)